MEWFSDSVAVSQQHETCEVHKFLLIITPECACVGGVHCAAVSRFVYLINSPANCPMPLIFSVSEHLAWLIIHLHSIVAVQFAFSYLSRLT